MHFKPLTPFMLSSCPELESGVDLLYRIQGFGKIEVEEPGKLVRMFNFILQVRYDDRSSCRRL